ncbi:hypothetical protein VKT23_011110 [Stygiomarasmius scandens]|uniref:Uncharacterized protein n=1 Tax=Marasmiellus scandens TaxID=2682957 RepID=A0ABR1JEL4_9AGAR
MHRHNVKSRDKTTTKSKASNSYVFSRDRRFLKAVEDLRTNVWRPDKRIERLDWVFGVDVERIARALRNAIRNKVVLPIKAGEYFALSPPQRDQKLSGRQHQLYDEGVVFVDEDGVSLVWYLPDLLSNEVKSKIHHKTILIQRKFASFVAAANDVEVGEGSTRAKKRRKISEHQFIDRKVIPTVFPGVCTFSLACKDLNHDGPMRPQSMNLETPVDMVPQTEEWLTQISEHQIIVSLVLSFIHPELYQVGKRTLEKCFQEAPHQTLEWGTVEWGKKWNSVFTTLTVVSSRTTVRQVESEGAVNYFEALMGVGTANKATLSLHELNVSFRYKSGTGVFFSGQGWTHEIPDWDTGEYLSYESRIQPEMIEYGGDKVEGYGLKL